MAIGIPYDLFWHLNPNKLSSFYKAYNLKRKIEDEKMWMMGQYIMSALDSTVCNNVLWKGKNGRQSKYFEQPIMQKKFEETFMTQEEIDSRELDKMILAEEMWIRNDKKRGLPETVIK